MDMTGRLAMRIKMYVFLIILLLLSLYNEQALGQSRTIENVIEEASYSIVKINVYDITGSKKAEGSGFFINDGRILTNYHVIEGAYSIEVISYFDTYENVTIEKSNEDTDLALLSVNSKYDIPYIS